MAKRWAPRQSEDPTRQVRVFIVEDSPLVRDRLVEVLGTLSYVKFVGHAGAVRDALDWIPLARPHVVLLDLGLPDGSGLHVLKGIQGMKPAPAVAIITNYATASLRKRCLDAGADVFLDKSLEFHRIPDVLEELARTRA
jgi:DNA-binding NarL/FixJ family response regulator